MDNELLKDILTSIALVYTLGIGVNFSFHFPYEHFKEYWCETTVNAEGRDVLTNKGFVMLMLLVCGSVFTLLAAVADDLIHERGSLSLDQGDRW